MNIAKRSHELANSIMPLITTGINNSNAGTVRDAIAQSIELLCAEVKESCYRPERIQSKEPRQAFEDAIKAGRLSANPDDENYAGHYMYMGIATDGVKDAFKHRVTRQYIK